MNAAHPAARVRCATTADADAIWRIYAPVVRESPASFETVEPSVVEMARRISAIVESYPWLVCERDGIVRGYAYACRHRERAAYRWCADTAVYVAGDARRSGVGGMLYEALFGLLRLQKYVTAFAGITLPNDASVRLHESAGFRPIGVYPRVGYKLGSWHDTGWWYLRLCEPAVPPPEPLSFSEVRDTPACAAILAGASG